MLALAGHHGMGTRRGCSADGRGTGGTGSQRLRLRSVRQVSPSPRQYFLLSCQYLSRIGNDVRRRPWLNGGGNGFHPAFPEGTAAFAQYPGLSAWRSRWQRTETRLSAEHRQCALGATGTFLLTRVS